MMDYKIRYQCLMDRARRRGQPNAPYEMHHIVPRRFGGDDTEVVCLTIGEHLFAHWMLTKFLVGDERQYALRVFNAMANKRRYTKFLKVVRQEEILAQAEEHVKMFSNLSASNKLRHEELDHAASQFLVFGGLKKKRDSKNRKRLQKTQSVSAGL